MTSPIQLRTIAAALLFLQCCIAARPVSDTVDWNRLPSADVQQRSKLNSRPLVGILSQPGSPAPKGNSYIAASYIKFVESAGARAVPLLFDLPQEELIDRFKKINAVLIPGGGQNLSPGHKFYDSAELLIELAKRANDDGDFFAVHGTCLGFETMAIIAARNTSLLSRYMAEDNPAPLYLTEKAEASRFFQGLPPQVVVDLTHQPYAMENHGNGLSWEAYDANPELSALYEVLSLSVDRVGRVYISTMEARKYPFTATQWHPEKNAFEWTPNLHIPHDPSAIDVTTAVAKFVVDAARRNMHQPDTRLDEDRLLIYNWAPEFTGKHHYEGEEVEFDQSYFFPAAEEFLRIERDMYGDVKAAAQQPKQ